MTHRLLALTDDRNKLGQVRNILLTIYFILTFLFNLFDNRSYWIIIHFRWKRFFISLLPLIHKRNSDRCPSIWNLLGLNSFVQSNVCHVAIHTWTPCSISISSTILSLLRVRFKLEIMAIIKAIGFEINHWKNVVVLKLLKVNFHVRVLSVLLSHMSIVYLVNKFAFHFFIALIADGFISHWSAGGYVSCIRGTSLGFVTASLVVGPQCFPVISFVCRHNLFFLHELNCFGSFVQQR
mgnify:CR=1 FL=1